LEEQKFEFVIICVFDDKMVLNALYELDWNIFLKHKHWHSRMQAWNLVLSNKLISDCCIRYERLNH